MTERRAYAPGTWIWVPDKDIVWRKAEVLEALSGGNIKVKIEDFGTETILSADVPTHLCNLEIFSSDGLTGLDDLTQLTHLHEPAVLNSLNLRFDIDNIYTFTGPILIAVNPFKTIHSMYDNETILRFLKSSEHNVQNQKRVPHVFATGSIAFRGLCDSKTSQTILISGESGAGKTESTKFVMKLLALAGSEDWNNRSQIENQVLQSNPLLEALGNAKTLRNDNSSRFGKFIEMQFTLASKRGAESLVGRLAGARIHTYLLETVRVCHQLEGERNYHSFYQLCGAAATTGDSGIYKFPTVIAEKAPEAKPQDFDLSKFASFDNFRYLTKSSCSKLARINDVEEFENTILAMQTIGIPLEEQIALFNVIGAVLYLGNIQLEAPPSNSEGSAIKADCRPSFNLVANLLGLSEELLEKALTVRTITAMNDTYGIPLKVREAEDVRDALAKALYGTAFLKLVKRTNQSIGYRDDVSLFCGVLDIFGFECFQFNSFEQLCINFTNERLQQFFNNFIFKCEEELYKREDIPWSSLDFPDNQDCVELVEKKNVGIFAMLDEECMVPRGSDQGFCNKMKEKHKNNKRFGAIKTKPEWFIINHFAGPVSYCVEGFLDKNRNQLSVDSQDCIKESSSEFVRNLFVEFLNRESGDEKTAKKRSATVSSEFGSQLNYLMETVAQTAPHFIRCVKPNPRNVPDEFERSTVTEQLRYGGVLQAVQVSRAGYPIRLPHDEAYLDYQYLRSKNACADLDGPSVTHKERISRLMTHLEEKFHFPKPAHSVNSWAVGQTMVFFKHESYEVLSAERAALRGAKACYIQSRWKGNQQRRMHLLLRRCVIVIQARIRGVLGRRRAQGIRRERAARRIQGLVRQFLARAAYLRVKSHAIAIQSAWRGYKARERMVEFKRFVAAQRIQAQWKGFKARSYYKRLRRATLLAQLCWRQILAKRQLRRLRQEQREAGALLAQNQKLQDENKALKAKADEAVSQQVLLVADRDRLASHVTQLETELQSLSAQIEELRSTTQLKPLPSNDSVSSDSRISLDQPSSPIPPAAALPRSPTSDVVTTPSPTCRRQPSISEKNVSSSSKKLEEQNSQENAPSDEIRTSDVAHHIEKAVEVARAADFEIMKQKDSYIDELRTKLKELEASLAEQKDRRSATPLQFGPTSNGVIPKITCESKPNASGIKSIDILVVGDESSGKSELVKKLVFQYGEGQPIDDTTSDVVIRHNRITFEGHTVSVSEFLEEPATLTDAVKDCASKCRYLIIVYDLAAESSYRHAYRYTNMTSRHPPRIFFGNRSALETGVDAVDISEIKDYAASAHCLAVEGSSLTDVLENICNELQGSRTQSVSSHAVGEETKAEIGRNRDSSLFAIQSRHAFSGTATPSGAAPSSLMSRIRSYFGTTEEAMFGSQTRNNILRRSTADTLPVSQRLPGGNIQADGCLQAVTELPDNPAAITCMAFGRERAQRDYYLLAAACKDGSVTVYRVNRTEMEKQMWDTEVAPLNNSVETGQSFLATETNGSTKEGDVTVVAQLFGHTRAITQLFFSYKEDQLVTTSIDKSIRFWSLETGDMLKVFVDSTSCLVAAFLPFNPFLFMVGNANSILRIVDVRNGRVLQKLRAESEVQAVKFDETGLYCYAGTRNGMLHVLESNDSGNIQFKFKNKLSKGSITCITYVPSTGVDTPPQLFVNSCDSTITIVDCIFGQPTGTLSTVIVRHRVKVAHSVLPLRCCYSAAGGGWLISASEDRNVHIYNVAPNAGYRSVLLRRHRAPVVTVAVNQHNSVLASADSCGKIVLWRWMQYQPVDPGAPLS